MCSAVAIAPAAFAGVAKGVGAVLHAFGAVVSRLIVLGLLVLGERRLERDDSRHHLLDLRQTVSFLKAAFDGLAKSLCGRLGR